ncbi:MAG: TonB-dependent receptor, partial [Bacteroidales bacterium]|nr:TonB-dependent receptor [Bacteroidales bacterium]
MRALTSYTYNYRENPGAALSNTVNEGLSWETSYTYNVALEFGLFDQRITGTVEYFNRDSKDLLQDVPISTVTGFSSTLQNIGEINNKGFEIELSGDIIKGNDFNWSAGLTASLIKSKVVELYDGEDINWYDPTGTDSRVDYIYREGEAVLSVYGYEWAGVNPDNGLNMWYVNNPEKEASLLASGDAFAHYKDGRTVVEGDTYSECDKVILGDLQPKIYGG